jgi:glutaryl-CoA dehydrogenase
MSAPDPDPLQLEDLLTEEERAVRERVRAFCDREIRPYINDLWERAEFPHHALAGYAKLGIVGGTLSEWGGPGLSARASGIAAMELARCDGSISTFHGVHSGLAARSIAMLGSDAQRAEWLPKMCALESIGAFGLTEPDHGSDAVHLETRALRRGNEWVLHGRKRWIGNATFADVIVLWARSEETGEVNGFLVPGDAVGLETNPITGKIGKRASIQADIHLDGVRVPDEARLPGAQTFEDAARVLAQARPGVAWAALGHAVAAYEIAFSYASERASFGKPLAGQQLVQNALARMLAEIVAMQLICMRVAELTDHGNLTAAVASLAKMNNAAKARTVVSMARDLMGGNGLLLEYHVARHLTDIEVTYTVEGTDFVQAMIVGREITGISAFG